MRFAERVHWLQASGLFLVSTVSVLLLAACSAEDTPTEPAVDAADSVLLNGVVYTVDADRSQAEALAIRDGRVLAIGSNADIEAMVGPDTRVIDLDGGMALPGFHDAHVHPTMGGYALAGCNLESERSIQAILDAVEACHRQNPEGWLEGHAFDLSLFGQDGASRSLLDGISTERPIVLWASDGHNAWVNTLALELAEIAAETPDPDLGVIEREADGRPSGTLRETAQDRKSVV